MKLLDLEPFGGNDYSGEIRNDSNRPLGYVEQNYSITADGYNNAMETISNWEKNTPNWSLDNNCMNFMMDVFDSSGAERNFNIEDWKTNSWLDPRKAFDWFLKNGGIIKE